MARKYIIDDKFNIANIIKLIEHHSEKVDVLLFFNKGSKIYLNSANLQILQAIAKNLDKVVKFDVENEQHKDYITNVNSEEVMFNSSEIELDNNSDLIIDNESSLSKGSSFIDHLLSIKESVSKIKNKVMKNTQKSEVKNFDNHVLRNVLITLSIIFIIIVSILWAVIWYLPTAVVKINLGSDVMVKLLDVRASVDAKEVDAKTGIIPALMLEVEEVGSQTIDVTGEKETGEKANGNIVIYNKTDEEIKLKKGVVLDYKEDKDGEDKKSEALKYLIKKDVTISKKEQKEEKTITNGTETTSIVEVFGKSEVEIEAIEYGDKYNLDKNSKFSTSKYDYKDELYGINEEDKISGGSVEKIKVVSEENLKEVTKQLEEFLKTKTLDSLKKKVVSGQKLEESSVLYELTNKEYSNVLDEKAEELTLKATQKATGLIYNEKDLEAAIKELMKGIIPSEFSLNGQDFDYEVAVTRSTQSKDLLLQVKLRTYVTPILDESKVRRDLVSMSVSEARDYLDKIKNIKAYEIKLEPNLLGLLRAMPKQENNIKIEITR